MRRQLRKSTASRFVVILATIALAAAACAGEAGTTTTEGASATTEGPTATTQPVQTTTSAAVAEDDPIVVGSTLALTGAFGAVGVIHELVGRQFVERLNAQGGLLGRPVVWEVTDDESNPENASAIYERLVSEGEVDLIMGPYATPNIVAAQAVAERVGWVLPNHTAALSYALTYECQFPSWASGEQPDSDVPNLVFDMLQARENPPETMVIVTNQAGSTDFISNGEPGADSGGATRIAAERGFEVVAEIPFPPDIADWGPVASQIRDLDPDFVWLSGVALDPVNLIDAMSQLDYEANELFALFPAPGPVLGLGETGENVLSISFFEPNPPVLERLDPVASEIVDEFTDAAIEAGFPYSVFDTQAAASWTAWEFLVQGVEGAGSFDHGAICDYLATEGAETTFYEPSLIEFNPDANNFYPHRLSVKQVQDGEWVMVWPEETAAAEYRPPSG